jgi:hypothetical protein
MATMTVAVSKLETRGVVRQSEAAGSETGEEPVAFMGRSFDLEQAPVHRLYAFLMGQPQSPHRILTRGGAGLELKPNPACEAHDV